MRNLNGSRMRADRLQIFIDSADISAIKAIDVIEIDGITTNPSLIAKQIKNSAKTTLYEEYKKILAAVAALVKGPVSAEVTETTYDKMLEQAIDLATVAKNIIIKLPITREGLMACKTLTLKHFIDVNMTLCFTPTQAVLAAKNGAKYISPFIGRIDDIGANGVDLIRDIKTVYETYQFHTRILAASIRNIGHVIEVLKLGVHAITVPPSLIDAMYKHILTDRGLEIFTDDLKKVTV